MFFDNSKLGFIIKGVFRVRLHPTTANETGRKHSALAYRIKGNSNFYCNGSCQAPGSGTVIYIPAGVDYQRVTECEEQLITLHLEAFGKDETEIQLIEGCEYLRPFFETLCELWERKEYNKCVRTLYKIFDEIKEKSQSGIKAIPQTIAAGVEYMNLNFRSHEISVAQIASKCHVSETYFRKIYRAHFGISPVQALLDLRFNYAKNLLRSGYYEIKQVASLSGFSDTKYFRSSFKKRFGMTPNEYAEKYSD